MLSVGVLGSGASYYTKLASEDYYLGSGEPPGRWWGSGAEALGLSGIVDATTFAALAAGFHQGKALTRNAKHPRRRAGFDLTFSAPKSTTMAQPALRFASESGIGAPEYTAGVVPVLTSA